MLCASGYCLYNQLSSSSYICVELNMNFKNRYFKSEDHKCRSLEEDVSAIECAKGLKIINNLFCIIDTTMNCEIYNGAS